MKKFTLLIALVAVFGWSGIQADTAHAVCGDGVVNDLDENPANDVDGDGACEEVEGCEQCDDGNTDTGDGCGATCRWECDFNMAGKAKGSKLSMVRAYAPCPGSQHPAINFGGAVPACDPPLPRAIGSGSPSTYEFSEKKGGCSIKTKQKINKVCSTATNPQTKAPLGIVNDDPCAELFISLSCGGINQAGGIPINPNQDDNWAIFSLTRSSLAESTIGPATVVDFPVTFEGITPDGGKIKYASSSSVALFGIFGPTTTLSACSNLETVEITVLDPLGRPFASLGTSSKPKGDIGLGE